MEQYKDIFGKPNEGVHSYRMFGLAAVDVGLTLVLIGSIAYWGNINIFVVFVVVVLLTIGIHALFGVETALNVALGIAKKENVKEKAKEKVV
jgi:hypothetical protein